MAVDGTQWDGNGDHAGGFNPRGTKDTSQKSAKQGNSIDNFMRAIGQQESGGNYDLTNSDSGAAGKFQIMPENWSAWAKDAGLSPDAPMTPENQELVAKNKMQEYYNKFGNWRDVAIAWYAGEGAISFSEEAKNRPQYSNGNRYPSINEYADSVMTRFEKFGGEVRQKETPQEEPTKPLFDLNAQDSTTQKLLEQFAREKRDASGGIEAAEDFDFFSGMFTDKDKFKNTAENRVAILDSYGEEFSTWAADKIPQTQTQLAQSDGRRASTTEVITGSRTAHQVQYRVVEASELNSSHEIYNGGVFANKNYPSELQPPNRERADMQAQLIRMSNSINPADLMDARDVNQGAPPQSATPTRTAKVKPTKMRWSETPNGSA